MQTDAVDGRQSDSPGNDILDLLQFAVQGIISLNDLLAVVVEHLALAGQTELFLAPFDQQRFEDTFKRTNLLADCGLRHTIDLRGFREAFRLCQITKHLKALNLHKNRKYKKRLSQSTNVFNETMLKPWRAIAVFCQEEFVS